jgi:hypothetical protein
MTICLRCDHCLKAVASHEEDLGRWWSLMRYETQLVGELGTGVYDSTLYTAPVWVDDYGGYAEGYVEFRGERRPSLSTYSDDTSDADGEYEDVSCIVLNFCSIQCLSAWAEQAKLVEPEEGELFD